MAAQTLPQIRCPRCARTIYEPQEVEKGFCSACNASTSLRARTRETVSSALAACDLYAFNKVMLGTVGLYPTGVAEATALVLLEGMPATFQRWWSSRIPTLAPSTS